MMSEEALRMVRVSYWEVTAQASKNVGLVPETQCIDVEKDEFDTRTLLHCFHRSWVWCQESTAEASKINLF